MRFLVNSCLVGVSHSRCPSQDGFGEGRLHRTLTGKTQRGQTADSASSLVVSIGRNGPRATVRIWKPAPKETTN